MDEAREAADRLRAVWAAFEDALDELHGVIFDVRPCRHEDGSLMFPLAKSRTTCSEPLLPDRQNTESPETE